jgi:hypothetical protein
MKKLAALLLLAVLPLATWAADPPGRVARLSLVEGEAAVFVDAEAGWEAARINLSLTGENSLWTEPGARAEMRFGAIALRLGEATQVDILRLDDEVFHAHVPRGALAVRIGEFGRSEVFVVSTPEGRFHLRGNGRYRVESDPARGESLLTVFNGTAQVEAAGGTINVDTGRSIRVAGGERPRFEFENAYTSALDEWALARDRQWEERESARYVPRQMTGWEDLDDYGAWRNEAEYGPVWYPTRVDASWAPYRYGRWTWVRPWGWTWVDDAPWGYAPFHYGRWVNIGNRWGWYPGRYTARPIWAPALVGWIGGSGWSISISSGYGSAMGWYPLSPYDNYQPWYTHNVTYVNYVNRIVLPPHHRREHQHDRNDQRRDNREHGATVVPRDQFGTRRPVQSIRATVPGEVVSRQPVVAGAAVLPTRNEARQRDRAAQPVPAAPVVRTPSSGRPAPTPKPVFRTESPAPASGTPAAAPTQPGAAARPTTPAPQTRTPESRQPATRTAPAPAERTPQPATRTAPAPAERTPQPATRTSPAPAERTPQPATRTAPAPAERTPQPATRTAPAPVERTPQPATRTAPAPVERTPQPATRTAPATRPAPAPAPATRPAPEKAPTPAPRSAPPAEKPAAPAEQPTKGNEPVPPRSGDKPGRG